MEASNGLTVVVALNEAAKSMSERASLVRICALDAQVRNAKDRSATLAGFREVSLQMRRWSDDLSQQLDRLRKLCSESVQEESAYRTLQRKARVLRSAEQESHSKHLLQCVSSMEARESNARQKRRDALARMVIELDDLRQLGMMAVVLSRTAMIEVASALPEERAVLVHVAQEFGTHAEAVLKLGKELMPLAAEAKRDWS